MNSNLEKDMREIQEDYPELKGITFEKLIDMLKNKPFEYVMYEIKDSLDILVECVKNDVYEDEDLYTFLTGIGAEIYKYIDNITNAGEPDNVVIIRTYDNKYYQLPSRDIENRFGLEIPETIINFNPKLIKDVTELYSRRISMTKEEAEELLDATNTVCMYCVEDTLTQEEICENCPVRKLCMKALKYDEN